MYLFEYEYTLIVGTLDEIRQFVYKEHSRLPLPDYRFEKDRQHWVYRSAVDTGWPIQGHLHIKLEENNPQIIGPQTFWKASDVPTMYIHAACKTNQTDARLLWKTFARPNFSSQRSVAFTLKPDESYHTYKIDLSNCPDYKGNITAIRLDPVSAGAEGEYIKIKSISCKKPGQL
jgi:hypothetical protein